jgi:hypothetical protein
MILIYFILIIIWNGIRKLIIIILQKSIVKFRWITSWMDIEIRKTSYKKRRLAQKRLGVKKKVFII